MRGPVDAFAAHLGTLVVGLFLAVGATFFFLDFGGALFRGDTYRVEAALPTSAALVKGSRVTMAGVKVGSVAGVRRDGSRTVVDLDLDDERVVPIPDDTKITLRQRTPVGESYIALTPGTSRQKLPDGGALPVSQSEEYVDVDQLLSTLQGPAGPATRKLVQGLGEGVRGRGPQLNRTLGDGSAVLRTGGLLATQLGAQRNQVAGLVDRLGRLSAAIGERSASVDVIAQQGLTSMRAVASRDAALRRIIDVLPATLDQVRSSSQTLTALSQTATPVVADLAAAMHDVRPAVANLRPAAQEGREVVRELGAAAPPLTGTLGRVRSLSGPLSQALPALQRTTCEIAPITRWIKPYTDDAIASVLGLGSASNSYDAVGHLIRLDPIVGANSLAGAPKEVNDAVDTLTQSGLLGQSGALSWNPYPKPGRIGKDGAGLNGAPRLTGPAALAASGYVYPHVQPDC